jgi:molecular chaperone DnaK
MSRIKIDYGIDLGTTNSAIAKMVQGNVRIIKSEFFQKDTLPSCVGFMQRRDRSVITVGDEAYSQLERDRRMKFADPNYASEIFIEFKRTMGTDKRYSSQVMEKSFSSEELSAEVLKKLKSFELDEKFDAVIVTVPAKFTLNQKDATVNAAKLAGFDYCELIQEPVAASIAFGMESEIKDGFWIVFDFGGGTFDIALMKVEDGIMKVIDTDGDNNLGGKNIDYAIIDEILISYLKENYSIDSVLSDPVRLNDFRNEWKGMIEKAKIELSYTTKDYVDMLTELGEDYGKDDDGNLIELDLKFTKAEFERIASPFFQEAVDITNNLLKRNNLSGEDLATIILVGGPTHTPLLRNMLKKQVSEKVNTDKDPMTVVAEGAALYASTVDIPNIIVKKNIDEQSVMLDVGFESSSVELSEYISVKVADNQSQQISDSSGLQIEISRGTGWSTGRIPFNVRGEVIEVRLEANKSNIFRIDLFDSKGDRIKISPSEFTVLQGFKQGQSGATLPYHIGIEVHDEVLKRDEFIPIKGLEKNATTPVTGIENGLRTPRELRPGNIENIINIPLYQGDHNSVGTKAFYNHYIADVIISGDDIPALIPVNSPINLTVKVMRDEQMTVAAYFPTIDYTVEKEVKIRSTSIPSSTVIKNYIERAIEQTYHSSYVDHSEKISEIRAILEDLLIKLEQGGADYERQNHVLGDLRKQQIELDILEKELELPKMKEILESNFYEVEKLIKEIEDKGFAEGSRLNLQNTKTALEDFRKNIRTVLSNTTNHNQQIRDIQRLDHELRMFDFQIRDTLAGVYSKIELIKGIHNEFHIIKWKDPQRARALIDKGLEMAVRNPSENELLQIMKEIVKLFADEEQSKLLKGM